MLTNDNELIICIMLHIINVFFSFILMKYVGAKIITVKQITI